MGSSSWINQESSMVDSLILVHLSSSICIPYDGHHRYKRSSRNPAWIFSIRYYLQVWCWFGNLQHHHGKICCDQGWRRRSSFDVTCFCDSGELILILKNKL